MKIDGSVTIGDIDDIDSAIEAYLNTKDLSINGGKSYFGSDGSGWLANHAIEWNSGGTLTIRGELQATTGKIGLFNIDSRGLYYGDTSKWSDTSFNQNLAYLTPSALRVQRAVGYFSAGDVANIRAGIGSGADPAYGENDGYCHSAAYFYRNMNDIDTIYYPAVKIISKNVVNRDVALYTKGATVIEGGLLENGYFMDADSVTVLDFSFGSTVVVSNSVYRYIYLPKYQDMRKLMNTSTGNFIVPVTIIAHTANSQSFIVRFQDGQTSLYFRDNDGDQWKTEHTMARGDILRIALVWDGTNYYAYLLDYRD